MYVQDALPGKSWSEGMIRFLPSQKNLMRPLSPFGPLMAWYQDLDQSDICHLCKSDDYTAYIL